MLEIGAGNTPHLNYLKHDYDEYFIAETSKPKEKTLKEKKKNKRSKPKKKWWN